MDNIELFHNLVNLAAADGKFTPEEVEFLATRAEIWNISNDEFETAIAGISEGNVEVKIPESIHDRRQLMKEMIRLMAVDGELAEMEKRICATASSRMDFTSQQFSELLTEVINDG